MTDYRALAEYVARISSAKKKIVFFKNGNHVIEYNPLTVEWALEFFGLIEREVYLNPPLASDQTGSDFVFERMQ